MVSPEAVEVQIVYREGHEQSSNVVASNAERADCAGADTHPGLEGWSGVCEDGAQFTGDHPWQSHSPRPSPVRLRAAPQRSHAVSARNWPAAPSWTRMKMPTSSTTSLS